MATDNDATAILAELRATLDQLERVGVRVGQVQDGPVLWIGIMGARLRAGVMEYDSAAVLAAEVTHGDSVV